MFKEITIIVLVFALFYLGYIVFEHYYYNYLRKKIKKIIHVNGIRGKSTTTRLIDAGLRGCGLKVASKTTGTLPIYINTKGEEIRINRLGPANIREQLKVLRRAVKDGCDYLVLECMAVNPELQDICEHKMLHSDVVVITNVRHDHLDVMGEDLISIAKSLANTVPSNGALVLGEEIKDDLFCVFSDKANELNTNVFKSSGEDTNYDFNTQKENVNCAISVCKVLGLDEKLFIEGMKKYLPDPGAFSINKLSINDKLITFINGFSINDPDSILKIYNDLNYNHEDITLVLNERGDRFFRTKQHLEMIDKMKFKRVLICGENNKYIYNKLKGKNIDCLIIKKIDDIDFNNNDIIFGIGNIKGFGFELIDYFKKGVK